jgi:type I restriction enzyme S subunit
MSSVHDSFLANLPSGWVFDRFKDVAVLRNERTGEASEVEDYLELEDLESGTGRILNRRNTLEVVSDVTVFKKGDVLFGKLRPYLEKYYVAEFDGKCTGEILAFRPERIESRFLFYCLASSWFIERCNLLAYGAKMPRVNWPTQLAQFNLPLPPLPEQQRIAAYLDASCAAIDAAAAAKRHQLETLDALRRSNIHRIVTRGLDDSVELKESAVEWLGRIPAHWAIKRIKDIVELKSGDAITSDSITPIGEYPVFGGNGLRGYTTSFTHSGYYALIGRQGALCGNINYASGPFWASEHAVVATTIRKHDTFWLGELLRMMNLTQLPNLVWPLKE